MSAVVSIPLTQGKVAVIDFEDFEKVRGLKWCAVNQHGCWYAMRHGPTIRGKRVTIYLHRMIFSESANKTVDHKDGDGLNNRRENLRIATQRQNTQNRHRKKTDASSKYKGVYWHTRDLVWGAQIETSEKNLYLGSFNSEEEAARAYDTKARELFGEFAAPNFPL